MNWKRLPARWLSWCQEILRKLLGKGWEYSEMDRTAVIATWLSKGVSGTIVAMIIWRPGCTRLISNWIKSMFNMKHEGTQVECKPKSLSIRKSYALGRTYYCCFSKGPVVKLPFKYVYLLKQFVSASCLCPGRLFIQRILVHGECLNLTVT